MPRVSPSPNAGEVAGAAWGKLRLLPSGAAFAPELSLLAASDLHLGKSERAARRGGPLLPPYDFDATLTRLEAELAALDPQVVVLVGDSFDDDAAAQALSVEHRRRLVAAAQGRRWVWVSGNHDPAAGAQVSGEVVEALRIGDLVFRHQADMKDAGGGLEISGHYHPKAVLHARGRRISRRCFLADGPGVHVGRGSRLILPAFGAYTGGLDVAEPVFDPLVGEAATAFLLGRRVVATARALLKERMRRRA